MFTLGNRSISRYATHIIYAASKKGSFGQYSILAYSEESGRAEETYCNNNNNNNEYKNGYAHVVKVIHWELNKKLKFHQTDKWYMHKPEAFHANETNKNLWNFEIQIDHWIPTRGSDIVFINTKKKKEPAILCILLSQLTTEWKWKKPKIWTNTQTFLESWMKVTVIQIMVGPLEQSKRTRPRWTGDLRKNWQQHY